MENQRLTLTKNNAIEMVEVEEVDITETKVLDSFLPPENFQNKKVSASANDQLRNHLPYSAIFDNSENIFENKSTYGFILRVSPFSGLAATDINSLSKMISYEIPYDAIVQVINYASPNIEHILSRWNNVVGKESGSIYSTLSKKRLEFYRSEQNVAKRNFELYFCVSFKAN